MSAPSPEQADRQIRDLVVQIEGLRAMIREREGMIASIQRGLATTQKDEDKG